MIANRKIGRIWQFSCEDKKIFKNIMMQIDY
jgi:hypothetical protein